MYESPIDIIYTDIQYKVVEEFDTNVVSAVQSYGIDVNKEELLKALRYDRQQYEKGYADAKSERRWIPCSERLPEPNEFVLVQNQNLQCFVFCMREEEVWYDYDFVYQNEGIIAWMPLPEPYKGEE